ncbi:hypothetical protein NBE98_13060 [Clostridium swellfunianum]|uniref:SHOCT-like domain-containing protein n=1 Tax=Clostridium swellfunianum TaxID=1367462 RepID=UPI002030CEF1|nr:hypothetical protein [Clostridium swellfunianum]MCM0649301.1 hypothetical protein [Clostridium swellfunianum]
MKEEVKRILKMVEEGKINSDKATELIEALNKTTAVSEMPVSSNLDRMLRIKVLSHDKDNVNVNVPVRFLKAVGSSIKNVPGLKENGVDIDIKTIMDAIDSGLEGKIVDIQTADGDIVDISIE